MPSRPRTGTATGRRPAGTRRVNRIPSAPAEATSSAPTSASAANPYVNARAAVRAAIRRTRSSSAFRTAVPVRGRASTSSPFACSTASIVPIRERWTGWTAVTTPMAGRAIRRQVGDLATDVHAHLEHRRLVLGPEPEDRQRQADLVVLVALVPKRFEAAAEDGRDRLLRRCLGDRAGHAHDERREPRAPGRRDRVERQEGIGNGQDRHVAQCRGSPRAAAVTRSAAAPAAAASARNR